MAVPLPGRLPTWSPLSVTIDDNARDVSVCRRDGYLWVVVPQGVHAKNAQSKECWPKRPNGNGAFVLKPRQVFINTPIGTWPGVAANGTPEQQVFFVRKQKAQQRPGRLRSQGFHAIVSVRRQIEAGLVWKVHNAVTRLSSAGKAISLKLPCWRAKAC